MIAQLSDQVHQYAALQGFLRKLKFVGVSADPAIDTGMLSLTKGLSSASKQCIHSRVTLHGHLARQRERL
jgi:hypothetical protein